MARTNKNSRRAASTIAIFLVFALLLAGTFAWQSVSQQTINQAIGGAAPAGGRLHDDFEVMGENFGEMIWRKGVNANKNIYVENFGNEGDRDIFVRLRLYEYMEVGQGANLHPGEDGFDTRAAIPLIAGADREDPTTWSPRLPGPDPDSDLFRSYWEWEQGGWKMFMPTFNRDPFSKEADVKGDAVDPQTLQPGEVANTTRRDTSPIGTHAFPAEAGLHNHFANNPTHEARVKYWDWSLNNGQGGHAISTTTVTHTAQPTPDATIVLMEDWDGSVGNYWVIDEDGWAYWAAPLEPGTATGLLLSSITLIQVPHQEWYYGIFVEAEMSTDDEWIYAPPTDPAIMRQVAHTLNAEGMFMESNVRNDAVISFEVVDLNMNNFSNEADVVESFNANGGFRGGQIVGARDLTHDVSESNVFVFWDVDNNFYLAGRGGVQAAGWGIGNMGSLSLMFSGTHNMVFVDVDLLDVSRVNHMSNLFNNASALTALDLSGWDTSNVTDMSHMFRGASSLESLDLSDWDTSRVTTMNWMFSDTTALQSLDVSGWDTSNVTTMNSMFFNASSLESIDLSGWDTSRVTSMNSMFESTTALQSLDVSGWDTSGLTSVWQMFFNASSLQSLNVSDWDTSNVTDMWRMFSNTNSLTALDLSGWDTSSLRDVSGMFWGASSLITLDVSGWDTSNVTTMNQAFRGTTALQSLDLSGWDTSRVTGMNGLFEDTPSLQTVDFRNATFDAMIHSALMFRNSGIDTMIVRDTAARDFIQSAPGWARVPARTITIVG